jgi:hypothetical protein
MISELKGCQLPVSSEPGHCFPTVPDYYLDWSLAGDTLTFSSPDPDDRGLAEVIKPWTRIESADQPETETASFPEGVYRMEVSSDELLARGVPPGQAAALGGVSTMVFDDGTWSAFDPSTPAPCPGTYEVVATGRVAVYFNANPPCSGPGDDVLFEANWRLDGDQLQFTDLTTETDDTQAFVDGFWGGQPWTRVDDALAPVDEEEPSDSGG